MDRFQGICHILKPELIVLFTGRLVGRTLVKSGGDLGRLGGLPATMALREVLKFFSGKLSCFGQMEK